MATQYFNELVPATSCFMYTGAGGSGIAITPSCYYAFATGNAPGGGQLAPGINNSGNLNLSWDIEINFKYIGTPSGGFYLYLVTSPSGGAPVSYCNSGAYEDGIPYINDGAHALTGPVTTPDSHNLIDVISAVDTGLHKIVLKDIMVDPYVIIPIIYNSETSSSGTGYFTMNVWGKYSQTIGP